MEKTFKGKIIKVVLNADTGYVSETGPCLGVVDDFLILQNKLTKKIQYISKYYIKYIEIIKDLEGSNLNGEIN